MENKEVKSELENVNGGTGGGDYIITCNNCGKVYACENASEHRTVGSGCDSYDEYKCPKCGTWQRG